MKLFKKAEFWLGAIVLVEVVVNVVWLWIDKTPPAWDQAAHLRSVMLVNQYLLGNFWSGFADLVRSFGGYPPLIYFIGGLWSIVFGVGVAQISFLNTFFLIAAIIGVYKLAGNKILPAILFSLFPVIYDISRNMLLDLALTVWVVWGLYFWLKSEDLNKAKYVWGLLVMLVLASLTKLNGFIYFGPMIIISIIEALKDSRSAVRTITGKLMGMGLLYFVIVGWWWGMNWQNIYQYLTGLAGQGETLTDPMNLFSWVTWIHYFRLFVLHQAGPVLAIVAIVSWIKMPKDGENKKLIFWTLATYVIFTVIKNKDFRFTMPILPVVAVWVGWWIFDWLGDRSRPVRTGLVGLFIFYLFFQFIENSFGWPVRKPVLGVTPTFLVGDIEWIGWDDYPVRAASGVMWPNEEIIKQMLLDGGMDNKKTVLVLMDTEQINDNDLKYYRERLTNKGDRVLEMHSVYEPNFDSWQDFELVLAGEREMEPAPFYATNLEYLKQARDWVWDNLDKFEEVEEYLLPDGQKLYLMRILK